MRPYCARIPDQSLNFLFYEKLGPLYNDGTGPSKYYSISDMVL